jgi:pyruvate dehydrogenase (quinone)
MPQLVADAVIDRLRAWGVHRIFGDPGDGIDPLLAALRRAGGDPGYVGARHEEGAALMATGHAKYTGGVGCCLASHGPGAVHLLDGLYDAMLDGCPVVAVVGQQHRSALGSTYQQEIDTTTLYKDVRSAYLATVTVPEQVPLVVDRAVRTALAAQAPTAIFLPHDVQVLDLPAEQPHRHGALVSSVGPSSAPCCRRRRVSTPPSPSWPPPSARRSWWVGGRRGRSTRWPSPIAWAPASPRRSLASRSSTRPCLMSADASATWGPTPRSASWTSATPCS